MGCTPDGCDHGGRRLPEGVAKDLNMVGGGGGVMERFIIIMMRN